ncbi:cholinephosphotransferase 1 isoform X4 [Dromaius novaehollandiae]|uniref:cholinephosphotransferase 1 isoform X4 n=1 Tax=Dromaius novaehollandiae TaxID=8790 RepID=UPI00311FC105
MAGPWALPAPLSPAQLKRLEQHHYSAAGRSLLEPSLQPYWNWLVEQVPPWLAPNAITLGGLLLNCLTALPLIACCPSATEQAPFWAYILGALGLFIYQSLDAIDGKQARRTNSSSPLGELFDHGCDSISTVFIVLGACIAIRLGTNPDWLFFCCFVGLFMFYSAHWQTYVSGILKFGKVDVIEVQLAITMLLLISACGGTAVWDYKGTSVLSPGLNIGLLITLAIMIYKKSTTQLFEKHPCLYVLTFGFVNAKISQKLVVAHMTKSEISLQDSAFIGPGLLFLDQYFNSFVDEYIVLWIALFVSLFDMLRYAIGVCLQIAAHLHIHVFRISSHQAPEQQSLNSQIKEFLTRKEELFHLKIYMQTMTVYGIYSHTGQNYQQAIKEVTLALRCLPFLPLRLLICYIICEGLI